MLTRLFDFDLPPSLIALRPAEPRDSARLMVVNPNGRIEHRVFREVGEYLRKGDAIVINDSRVIPARLFGSRPPRNPGGTEVPIEITLHKGIDPDTFLAFAKPAKRLRLGDWLNFGANLSGEVLSNRAGEVKIRFRYEGPTLDLAIAAVGQMPLPPYIAKLRPPDSRDVADYQTVYAAHDGSVAAPTAGLHFTPELIKRLESTGVKITPITLHVGAGTFLPVTSKNTEDHVMHSEYAYLSEETAKQLNCARKSGHHVVAAGTTVLRTLESAADERGQISAFEGDTSIFITPGYRFRAVDLLITNFHLPRSTLFMLVSACMGLELMQHAYAEAIRERYRFYSYGDACLLIRSL